MGDLWVSSLFSWYRSTFPGLPRGEVLCDRVVDLRLLDPEQTRLGQPYIDAIVDDLDSGDGRV